MFEIFKHRENPESTREIENALREIEREELERRLNGLGYKLDRRGALKVVIDTEGNEMFGAHDLYLVGDAIVAELGAGVYLIDSETFKPFLLRGDGEIEGLGADIRNVTAPRLESSNLIEDIIKGSDENRAVTLKLKDGRKLKLLPDLVSGGFEDSLM